MTFISGGGDHWWVPSKSEVGCDIMGFYSAFASVSGQLLVTQLAAYSYYAVVRKSPWSLESVRKVSFSAFVASLVYSILPLIGVGSYADGGEGFCYIDWSNTALVVLMELVTIPCMAACIYFFGKLFLYSGQMTEGYGAITQKFWIAAALSYISAWILWIPAAFIGLGSDEPFPEMFPHGYMISGGVLGHAQAILNPMLYGITWRTCFVLTEYVSGSGLKDDKTNIHYSDKINEQEADPESAPGLA